MRCCLAHPCSFEPCGELGGVCAAHDIESTREDSTSRIVSSKCCLDLEWPVFARLAFREQSRNKVDGLTPTRSIRSSAKPLWELSERLLAA